jgi:hypothetical protein
MELKPSEPFEPLEPSELPSVVPKLQRDAKVLLAQLPHRFLQVVFRG